MRTERSPRFIVYFNSGALGEFLMTLFFAERVSAHTPGIEFYIPVLRDASGLGALASQYPFVHVVDLSDRSLGSLVSLCLHSLATPTLGITQQTFGRIPSSIKFAARFLTLGAGSRLVGFDDGSRLNQWLYTKIMPFDPGKPIFESMLDLARLAGLPTDAERPSLSLPQTPGFLEQNDLVEGFYVVLAPFAASTHRSMPMKMIETVIADIRDRFPDRDLILTGSSSQLGLLLPFSGGRTRIVATKELTQLTTLIAHAALYIGVDTGTSHLAAVLRRPSVILGNNSNPCWLPSYNPEAIILTNDAECTCDRKKGGNCRIVLEGQEYYRCLATVSDEAIRQAIGSFDHTDSFGREAAR